MKHTRTPSLHPNMSVCRSAFGAVLILAALWGCQGPNNPATLPTALVSSDTQSSGEPLSVMDAVRSPDSRKLAFWQGIDERVVPFNQYHGVQLSIVAAGAAVKRKALNLTVQKDDEILDDQLWWQDARNLLLTGTEDNRQVLYRIDTETLEDTLQYTFPTRAHKLVPQQDKLYFLTGKSLSVLDTQTWQQNELISFSHEPVQLYPTSQSHLWLVGIGQSVADFQIQRPPAEPVSYYLVDLQSKRQRPCAQAASPDSSTTTWVLDSQAPNQQTVSCP